MRKIVAGMLCALLMTGSFCAALAAGEPVELSADLPEEQPGGLPAVTAPDLDDPIGIQPGTELVVGASARMSGSFATDMWGTNTADMDVRALLHGYETVSWTPTGSMQFNGVVLKDVSFEPNGQSNLYTFELCDDLFYNDGSRVTARDYVFSLLLSCAPQVAAIGGTPQGLNHLEGYDDYQRGITDAFAGVRLLSDARFQLSIRSESLPFFYGVALLQAQPYPLAVIAPGCEIRDDGRGAYIAAAAGAAQLQAEGYTPGEFSAEMLQVTMLDPETGYVFNPRVTSGPYSLDTYDAENSVATFVVNPYFKGNVLGQKPHIERLEMRTVPEEEALALLQSGELGLINKMLNDAVVMPALDAVSEGEMRMASYPRSGLAFLAFACEQGPASSQAVRRAVMLAVDRDAIVEGSPQTASATRVEGYYGLGQWMVSYADGGLLEGEGDGTEPQAESGGGTEEGLLSIPKKLDAMRELVDVEGAIALLEADGWTLNEAGEAFDPAAGGIRYRSAGGRLEPLVLSMVYSVDMPTADAVLAELTTTLPLLGIGLETTELPFPELLEHYYRQAERTYDMFCLATNFNYLFDPYYYFHTGDAYQGMLNTSGLRDEELMRLALDMRSTDSMDMKTYAEKWLLFQERFMEVAPMVPLYSNIYYDFYRNDLQGYNPITSSNWALAIPYAYISDVPLLGEDDLEGVALEGEETEGAEIDGGPLGGLEALPEAEPAAAP